MIADICINIQRNHSASINTIDSYAQKVVALWNSEHFSRLSRGDSGLGGALPLNIAKKRVERMCDLAVASKSGPDVFKSMFLPIPVRVPVTIPNAVLSERSLVPILPLAPRPAQKVTASNAGRKKKIRILPPLNELLEEKARELSHRDLLFYTRQMGSGSAPNRKDGPKGSLATVLGYIENRDLGVATRGMDEE